MNLINKTTRLHLIIAIPIFIVIAVAMYYIISSVIIAKVDESLITNKENIIDNILERRFIDSSYIDLSSIYSLEEITEREFGKDKFSNINVYDNLETEYEPYRQLSTSFTVNNNHYELKMRRSLVESESLIASIILIVFILFLLLTLSYLIINRRLMVSIWAPFYVTLKKLNRFKIDNNRPVVFEDTKITEFNQLNRTVDEMIRRIQNDYKRNKKFIDNIAHELHTPLSIIRGNIEVFVQGKNLSNEDLALIQSIENTVERLTRINRTLLLFSKIENNQFIETSKIDFGRLIKKIIKENEDYIEFEKIEVQDYLKTDNFVEMNKDLAEILFINLIQNSIKHNTEGGIIKLKSEEDYLEIANTGTRLGINPDQLFEKFVKKSKSSESVGLGLTIVKQICDLYDFNIKYSIKGHIHIINIHFNQLEQTD